MTPRLVHFFGPDGAGKTTQVKLLIDYYQNRGLKVRKYWVRSPHTFAYFLWKFLVSIGFYRAVVNCFDVEVKTPAVQNSAFLKKAWSLLEFFSVLPLIMRAQIYLRRGYTLIAERYLFDTVVTVAYFLDDPAFSKSLISRILLHFIPQNTNFIFLDTDFETIYKRRAKFYNQRISKNRQSVFTYGEVPAAALEPNHFIDFQRKMYASFARSYNALVIDTSKSSLEETFDQIVAYLNIT